jgi:hypothetical protein
MIPLLPLGWTAAAAGISYLIKAIGESKRTELELGDVRLRFDRGREAFLRQQAIAAAVRRAAPHLEPAIAERIAGSALAYDRFVEELIERTRTAGR